MMVIRELEPSHLPTVVGAHLATWSGDELSVRLGERFVDAFYRLAVDHPSTLSLGAWVAGDPQPCCWCLGFREYSDFNRRLRKTLGLRLVATVVSRVLSGALPLSEVTARVSGPPVHRRAACPEAHLGAFGQVGRGFEGVLALCTLVTHTARELCETSPACWAVTHARNRGAKTVLDRAGFVVVDELARGGREIAVYERGAE